MGVKDVFGKVFGFLGGVAPTLLKFSEVITLALSVLRIKMAKGDVAGVLATVAPLRRVQFGLARLSQELGEALDAVEQAVGDGGDGGSDITGTEGKEIVDEFADVAPVVADITADLAEAGKALRNLL